MKTKILFLAIIILFSAYSLVAQKYNPYVAKGTISQLLPSQLNGAGVASFEIGNKGTSAIALVKKQELKIKITLSYGIPDVDPLDASTAVGALSGDWVNFFSWTYNTKTRTFTGKQVSEIPAQSSGMINIRYKVEKDSPRSDPANGLNVNIVPPAYSNGYNSTTDDAANAYTNTQVGDQGDAPASYGTADHIIDFANQQNAVFLGATVDYDLIDRSSPMADADDMNGEDDEDGVTFPVLTAGTTVTIPVMVTEKGNAVGFLNAWADWNGNGSFEDPGEQFTTDMLVTTSGIVKIHAEIPSDAITATPTYARFRIGPANLTSTGSCAFGEVEDYQVQIQGPNTGIEPKDQSRQVIIYSNENNIFVKDLSGRDLRGKMIVYNMLGQKVAKKNLTGGTLAKFRMNVEEGYYIVEVNEDGVISKGKVFLAR